MKSNFKASQPWSLTFWSSLLRKLRAVEIIQHCALCICINELTEYVDRCANSWNLLGALQSSGEIKIQHKLDEFSRKEKKKSRGLSQQHFFESSMAGKTIVGKSMWAWALITYCRMTGAACWFWRKQTPIPYWSQTNELIANAQINYHCLLFVLWEKLKNTYTLIHRPIGDRWTNVN